SDEPLLAPENLAPMLRDRRDRPLFIIDIAVPRDVDPGVNEMEGVYLYDIDSLQSVAEQSLALRRPQIPAAEAIITEPIAASQARMLEKALNEKWPDLPTETKIIRTSGDESRSQAGNLRHGRKGLFTAEIEKALFARDVDLAVHSAKDLPSELTAGVEIAAVLP